MPYSGLGGDTSAKPCRTQPKNIPSQTTKNGVVVDRLYQSGFRRLNLQISGRASVAAPPRAEISHSPSCVVNHTFAQFGRNIVFSFISFPGHCYRRKSVEYLQTQMRDEACTCYHRSRKYFEANAESNLLQPTGLRLNEHFSKLDISEYRSLCEDHAYTERFFAILCSILF